MNEAITLSAGNCHMEILISHGGTIRDILLVPKSKKEAVAILKKDLPEEIDENPWFRGRILFPFCDRIPDSRYNFQGKEYILSPNDEDGSAIHGLIYNRAGTILNRKTGESFDELQLAWNLGADSGYPFQIEFIMTYRLIDDHDPRVELNFNARNIGGGPAPVGFGWHPYFTLPASCADELTLKLPAEKHIEVDKNLLPTGRFPEVAGSNSIYDFNSPRKIGNIEYDLAFPMIENPARVEISNGVYTIEMTTAGDFNFFQLFIPPDRESVALEPISNATNSFNRNDMGMANLQPGKSLTARVNIRLKLI